MTNADKELRKVPLAAPLRVDSSIVPMRATLEFLTACADEADRELPTGTYRRLPQTVAVSSATLRMLIRAAEELRRVE